MNKVKKGLALVLTLSMMLSLVSVLSGFDFFSKTVTMQFIANSVTNDKEVVKAINARLKELGLKFKFKGIWDNWEPRIGQNAIDSGDKSVDIVWAASWPQSYVEYARKGSFVALDDMLANYPDLKAAVPAAMWDAWSVPGADGKRAIYGVPAIKEYASVYAWDVNNTRMEELGIDIDSITWDENAIYTPEFEAALAASKEMYGDDFYPFCLEPEPFARHIHGGDFDVTGTDVLLIPFNLDDPSLPEKTRVSSIYDNSNVLKMINKLQEFYAKGYIDPNLAIDAVSSDTNTESWAAGEYLMHTRSITPGYDADFSAQRGIEIISYPIATYASTVGMQGSGHAISVYSKNQKEAMAFLNALYTDQELLNIVSYGAEGIHWNANGDGTVTKTDKGAAEFNPWVAGIATVYNVLPTDGQGADFFENYKAFNDAGVAVSFNGFNFDTTAVATQLAAINVVSKEYNMTMLAGAGDAAKLKEYKAELEKAGLRDVIKEFNNQLNDFYRAKEKAAAPAAAATEEAAAE